MFFEGTGQGVAGRKTNVSLLFEACEPEGQKLHLESGPGTHRWYFLRGKAFGDDWKKIFRSSRRWFEAEYERYDRVFLFGFSRGALLARHFAEWLDRLGIGVEYLGLWDTVDATPGLAVAERCPGNVLFARHAVAEHEARRYFAYVPLEGGQVEEELFPGVHSDVGGLYDDDHRLADAARAWIAEAAVARGLRIRAGIRLDEAAVDLSGATRHDSLRLVSNLFGLLGSVKRRFPADIPRHGIGNGAG